MKNTETVLKNTVSFLIMQFDIITIFPHIFDSYFKESIIARATKKKLIRLKIWDLRDFASDKRKTIDDKPYGGGLGMVMRVEPIYKAVKKAKKKNKKSRVILLTPRGKKFTQKVAYNFSKYDQLIFICGRYEGVDERVAKHIATDLISIGDYVLMGGEVASLVIIEAVSRLIPGVLGKEKLLKERIPYPKRSYIEYPYYTRPAVFEPKKGIKWKVPKVLLSGDHKKIEEWRKKHAKIIE